jgi:hypothetical protein
LLRSKVLNKRGGSCRFMYYEFDTLSYVKEIKMMMRTVQEVIYSKYFAAVHY